MRLHVQNAEIQFSQNHWEEKLLSVHVKSTQRSNLGIESSSRQIKGQVWGELGEKR